MILELRQWYAGRTLREQRLILLMLAIALPLLIWLLVVRPLGLAYDRALDAHLEAVDRNGRVRMLASAAKAGPPAGRAALPETDIAITVSEAASQAGLALDGNNPLGPNAVSVSITQARAPVATQWLRELEARGILVEELRMSPAGSDTVSITARLAKGD